MWQLLCVLVGRPGNVFSMMAEESLPVDTLHREIVEKINTGVEKSIQCSPARLKLFPARAGGSWLRKDDACLADLLSGAIPEVIKIIASGESISPSQQIRTAFGGEVPPTGVIHMLCAISPTSDDGSNPSKRRRLLSEWEHHKPDQFFRLGEEDMKGSGLPAPSLYLYCRPVFHELLTFLREKVCDEGCLGRIVGPPGCGKSVNALAFASTLDKSEWIVTWIKLCTMMNGRCIQVNGDKRETQTVNIYTNVDLGDILYVNDSKKRHLVLVDGWNRELFTKVTCECIEWLLEKGKNERRRLVFISSLASDCQFSEKVQLLTRAKRFVVPSWTLADYQSAVQNDELFESVSTYLDTREGLSDEKPPDKNSVPSMDVEEEMKCAVVLYAQRKAIVKAKYYYAGGCCRYMFQYGTRAVRENLDIAVTWARDAGSISSFEDCSSVGTSCLFGVFPAPGLQCIMQLLVSKYVATELAINCSEDALRNFVSTQRHWTSRVSNDDWILELLFFASLRFSGVTLLGKAGQEIDSWDRHWVEPWGGIPLNIPTDDMWIKPTHRHSDGFDAIKICKKDNFVRFVWVTSSQQYAFRMEYIREWLTKLARSSQHFEVKTLEVYFIVNQSKVVDFRLDPICGVGLLVDYGWPEFEEVGRVQVVGIRGLCHSKSALL